MPNTSVEENNATVYDVASHGDYHVFSFHEKFFFYDINNMNIYQINETLYYKLNTNRSGSDLFDNLLTSLRVKADTSLIKQTYSRGVMSISLNVAQVCNLSCVYCYGVDGEYGTKGKMNEETAFTSVDFLMSQSKTDASITIHFFGGEPLLNFPLMKKVVSYSIDQAKIKNRRLAFSITTNGTRFSDDVNAFLNEHQFNVIVSFDGDEDIQDKNRPFKNGKGSFATTKPKIERFLQSRNGNASARATVTNHSHDLTDLKKRLKSMGFRYAGATVATLSEFAVENRPVTNIDEQQKFNLLLESDNEATELLKAIKNRDTIYLKDLSDSKVLSHVKELHFKQKSYFSCGVGRGLLAISITGDIYPCHRFVGNDDFKMGNIKNYDSSSASKYEESYTQKHPVCSNCWAKFHCGGAGCIHDNYVTMGGVNNINTDHCTRLKNDLKNAVYIFSELDKTDREFLFNQKRIGRK